MKHYVRNIAILTIIGVFLFATLYIVEIPKKNEINFVFIGAPAGVAVADIAIINHSCFVVCNTHPKVFKIEEDSLVSHWGEYGIGELKFKVPEKIRAFDNFLFVSDLENMQVQAMDTIGNFVGIYPERSAADFLFRNPEDRSNSLSDFCIGTDLFVFCYGKFYEQVVAVVNRKTGAKYQIEQKFSLVSSMDLDEKSKRIYIADGGSKTLYVFNFTGQLLYSIGERGEIKHLFDRIEKIKVSSSGELYVLDFIADVSRQYTGYGAIHVYDSSMGYSRSIGVNDKKPILLMPKSFDFAGNDSLIVINQDGTMLYRLCLMKKGGEDE